MPFATRSSGTISRTCGPPNFAGRLRPDWLIRVRTNPGHSTWTWMFSGASWAAQPSVRATTANLEAL